MPLVRDHVTVDKKCATKQGDGFSRFQLLLTLSAIVRKVWRQGGMRIRKKAKQI